ncbi:hypothetical protein J1N35_004640 [Gossypium stocksii]|uniref:Uncharacterized protein n=1 Tax=Gossypium stocksii TaxID=47602 RepID=A0A9D3WDX5_9ROSI|nr:hypothetical protein J1N35_004640 [Gossypium stocksii]
MHGPKERDKWKDPELINLQWTDFDDQKRNKKSTMDSNSYDYVQRRDLNLLQNIDMDKVINCLTEKRGEWKRQSSTNLPLSFKQSNMSPEAKMWSQFICT